MGDDLVFLFSEVACVLLNSLASQRERGPVE